MTEANGQGRRRRRLPGWGIVALYLLAVLIRIIYLNQIDEMPIFDRPAMDERYHLHLVELISSNDMPEEPFFRAPLYPYFLTAVYNAVGESIYWSRMIQVLLGSFLPLLVLALGLRLFEHRVAWTAALATALYPTFIYYDAALLITFIMTLVTVLLLWQTYRAREHPTWLNFVLVGLLLGLAGLARPNILLFGPFLIIWFLVELRPRLGWSQSLGRYLVVGLCAAAVIAPVTIRNYQVSGDLVPVAWQGGYNFYIGNHRNANGWSATAPEIDKTWEGGYRESIAIAEQAAGRELSRAEVSDYWWHRGLDEIRADLGGWLALEFRKLRLIFQGIEIPNNQSLYMVNDYSGLMSVLMWHEGIGFPFGIVAPLALIGLAISLREWRKYLLVYLLMGSYLLSLLMFFVCARFRQPIMPLFILFAVLAVISLIDYLRDRDFKTAGVIAAVFVLLAVESNHNLLGISQGRMRAEGHLMIGNAYLEENMVGAARGEFRKAVAADSTFGNALNNLGMLLARQGNTMQARQYFVDALSHEPNNLVALNNLASISLNAGRVDEAIELLERARLINVADPITQLKLGAAYAAAGRLQEAYRAAQAAYRLDPSNPQARQLIEHLEAQLPAAPSGD